MAAEHTVEDVLRRLEAVERRVAQLAELVEDQTHLVCEQVSHLREAVDSLRGEVTEELFPRLIPQPEGLSPPAQAALDRLSRIRRRSSA